MAVTEDWYATNAGEENQGAEDDDHRARQAQHDYQAGDYWAPDWAHGHPSHQSVAADGGFQAGEREPGPYYDEEEEDVSGGNRTHFASNTGGTYERSNVSGMMQRYMNQPITHEPNVYSKQKVGGHGKHGTSDKKSAKENKDKTKEKEKKKKK